MKDINEIFSLKGKVAVVAGASRGIGEAIAEIYAAAGARVVMSSRKPQGINEAAERVRQATGADVLAVAASVGEPADRQRLIEESLDWGGRLDILVNNAGTNPAFGPLEAIEESAWDKTFDINVKALFFLSQLAYKAWMKEHGGSIIMTASIAAFSCMTGMNVYHTTKAALVHLTRCMASEWTPQGVRVNSIAPGVIQTKLSEAIWKNPKMDPAALIPVGRLGQPEDIAAVALLLASGAGGFISGETIVSDGGALVKPQ